MNDVLDARKAVLRQLAEAHDRFAEQEQALILEGLYPEAEGAKKYADWVLRAYRIEMDDPDWRHDA